MVLVTESHINLLEKEVFEPHQIDKKLIKEIAEDIYKYGVKKKIYEACSYANYWAIKYDFNIEISTLKEDSINSLDCVFLMISFLYDKKHNKLAYLKEYKDLSKQLKQDDFDRYWLFIYETLSTQELMGNYRIMKQNGLTFIKPGFI